MNDDSTTGPSSKESASNKSTPNEQFIIEIESPHTKLDMLTVQKLLKDSGIKLDLQYGPFLINPKLGHYVVRGFGDIESQQKAKQIPGVKLFRDRRIIGPS